MQQGRARGKAGASSRGAHHSSHAPQAFLHAVRTYPARPRSEHAGLPLLHSRGTSECRRRVPTAAPHHAPLLLQLPLAQGPTCFAHVCLDVILAVLAAHIERGALVGRCTEGGKPRSHSSRHGRSCRGRQAAQDSRQRAGSPAPPQVMCFCSRLLAPPLLCTRETLRPGRGRPTQPHGPVPPPAAAAALP